MLFDFKHRVRIMHNANVHTISTYRYQQYNIASYNTKTLTVCHNPILNLSSKYL